MRIGHISKLQSSQTQLQLGGARHAKQRHRGPFRNTNPKRLILGTHYFLYSLSLSSKDKVRAVRILMAARTDCDLLLGFSSASVEDFEQARRVQKFGCHWCGSSTKFGSGLPTHPVGNWTLENHCNNIGNPLSLAQKRRQITALLVRNLLILTHLL
jgi:hypothetical protein